MAYDEFLAERIRQRLGQAKLPLRELKMMGGLCFMVDDKMCMGVLQQKGTGRDFIMARIGEDAYESLLARPGCQPMDFTGRPMKGYVFVSDEGFDTDTDLDFWVEKCLAFNPLAKANKKKK
ncbi:TfoX/Sxy family protein [Sediminicola luteus]|uniref:RNA methyltransferase n=1 Tax=Sediminicola luteus TaxID=319238 RepID=A0A2A4G5V7_9FLAO|nr:TfoX/Sxy family protein [Sediminicola luteus]PCE63122.1 RNA methyltransferase [Sediminicola luteus]